MKKILAIILTSLCVNAVYAASPASKALIQHRVELNDHAFAVYEKRAEKTEDVLVLIHGRTISALPNFDLQLESKNISFMDAFVARGFTVYAIDLRGFGNTPRDKTGWNTPEKAAGDVAKLLEWVAARHPKKNKLSLFGYSLGSLHSQLIVQKNPELVSEVILFGYPISSLNNINQDAIRADKALVDPPRKSNSVEWSSDGFMTGQTPKAVIDAYVSACLKHDPVLVDWKRIDQWQQLDPKKINTPTLLINGVHDPYAPVDQLAPFFSRIKSPDKAWIVISKSGHNVHIENEAARLVNGVVNFIRRNR